MTLLVGCTHWSVGRLILIACKRVVCTSHFVAYTGHCLRTEQIAGNAQPLFKLAVIAHSSKRSLRTHGEALRRYHDFSKIEIVFDQNLAGLTTHVDYGNAALNVSKFVCARSPVTDCSIDIATTGTNHKSSGPRVFTQ